MSILFANDCDEREGMLICLDNPYTLHRNKFQNELHTLNAKLSDMTAEQWRLMLDIHLPETALNKSECLLILKLGMRSEKYKFVYDRRVTLLHPLSSSLLPFHTCDKLIRSQVSTGRFTTLLLLLPVPLTRALDRQWINILKYNSIEHVFCPIPERLLAWSKTKSHGQFFE